MAHWLIIPGVLLGLIAAQETCLPPGVTRHGVEVDYPVTATLSVEGRQISLSDIEPSLQLTYVHGFLELEEAENLVQMCEARDGWRQSFTTTQSAVGEKIQRSNRNSSSCMMLWPLLYRSKMALLQEKHPELLPELEMATRIGSRVSALFTESGIDLNPDRIEPLQLVRYKPGQLFEPHHDYHKTPASSMQGEQRLMTMLVFLSSIDAEDGGGTTRFPLLNISVLPRAGDAIMWANTDMSGNPEPQSLHEGVAPNRGEKYALNIWVADQPFDATKGVQNAFRAK